MSGPSSRNPTSANMCRTLFAAIISRTFKHFEFPTLHIHFQHINLRNLIIVTKIVDGVDLNQLSTTEDTFLRSRNTYCKRVAFGVFVKMHLTCPSGGTKSASNAMDVLHLAIPDAKPIVTGGDGLETENPCARKVLRHFPGRLPDVCTDIEENF
jgi:hypothetical protein